MTNVLTVSAADLSNLSEITFLNPLSSSAPLLINVTGTTFDDSTPNLAGISGSQAPSMLGTSRRPPRCMSPAFTLAGRRRLRRH